MPKETLQETAYVFAPILTKTKDDAGHLIVTGKITGPDLDLDGQRVDPAWAKTAVPDWFEIGNIREMHLPSAVGKANALEEKEDGWYISAKIVDPLAATKVEEGVYTGFSIGIKRPVIDTSAKALATAPGGVITGGTIIETSLADRACNESCKLVLAKVAVPGQDVVAVAGVQPDKMLDKGLVRTEEIVEKIPAGEYLTPGTIADGHALLVKATTTGGHIHEHTHEDGAHTHAHAHSPLPGHHDHDGTDAPPHSHAHDPKDPARQDAPAPGDGTGASEDPGNATSSPEDAQDPDTGKALDLGREALAKLVREEIARMAAEQGKAAVKPHAFDKGDDGKCTSCGETKADGMHTRDFGKAVALYSEAVSLLTKAGKAPDLTKVDTDHTAAYQSVISALADLISQEAAEMAGGDDEFACLSRLIAAYKWLLAFKQGENNEGELLDVGSPSPSEYPAYVPTPYIGQAAKPDLTKAAPKEDDVDAKVLAQLELLTKAVKPVERIEAIAGEMAELSKTVASQAETITAQNERLERIEKAPAGDGPRRTAPNSMGSAPVTPADEAKNKARSLMKLAGDASNPTLAEGYRAMAADALKAAGLDPNERL